MPSTRGHASRHRPSDTHNGRTGRRNRAGIAQFPEKRRRAIDLYDVLAPYVAGWKAPETPMGRLTRVRDEDDAVAVADA